MISIVAAIGENRELGANNKLLWHIPEDLKHFHDLTVGHPIIMGRKTHESIGRILPERTNIVITQNSSLKIQNAIVVHSLEEAIKIAKENVIANPERSRMGEAIPLDFPDTDGIASSLDSSLLAITHDSNENELFIIGGGQIFAKALPMAQRLYLTIIHASFPDADTFFPDYSMFTKVVEKEERESNGFGYTFLTLER